MLSPGKPPKGLDAATIKGLKQIVLCNKASTGTDCDPKYPPVMLAVPTDGTASKDSKPKLEDHDPVKVGTKEVTISGIGIDQIAVIKFEGSCRSDQETLVRLEVWLRTSEERRPTRRGQGSWPPQRRKFHQGLEWRSQHRRWRIRHTHRLTQ